MARIVIDGESYEVREGINLLEAIQSLGLDLPYFCWHPALGSVGSCRQCAIIKFKDEKDENGKLVMACMEPVEEGVRISIQDERAVKFRAAVIEWLMTNHPHDCPVCDEGGECHLQDMTEMSGHNYRRYRFKKRTFRNQYLGPFIYHEMNRCITCYRCVRFYNDYAGGTDLAAVGAHNHIYFGRLEDGVLESEFSGNLVEICPTGVFTDKPLRRHYSRKWDLQSSPSVCHHCGLGCNTFVGTRYDKPVRILNRYNPHVNGFFLCDRGRFGYDFINSDARITAIESDSGNERITDSNEAVEKAASIIKGSGAVIGFGSPRASLESNYALQKLVGPANYSVGIAEIEYSLLKKILSILTGGPVPSASLQDIGRADAVLILGEDLTQTAPIMALQVRQTTRNKLMAGIDKLKIPRWNDSAVRELLQDEKGPFYVVTTNATKLDHLADEVYHAAPDEIARLGFSIAAEIYGKAPSINDIPEKMRGLATRIASDLMDADNPVIISGTSNFNHSIIEAASNISLALHQSNKNVKISYTVPECNSLGAALQGGLDIEASFSKIDREKVRAVIILENDLYRRVSAEMVDGIFEHIENLIVIDCIRNRTTERADLLLPSAPYDENGGTIVNDEGRVQRFVRAVPGQGQARKGWRWLNDIMELSADDFKGWESLDEISRELFDSIDVLKGNYQDIWSPSRLIEGRRIARSPDPCSGRTAMHAHINVSEPKPPHDTDSPMAFSMEGYQGAPPKAITPFYRSPGWNSVQSLNRYREGIGRTLPGGDTGVRIIHPDPNPRLDYFDAVPERFEVETGSILLVPLYHIHGSEELSSLSRPAAELIPDPYIAVNEKQAAESGRNEGEIIRLNNGVIDIRLPLRINDSLPDGVGGFPAGFGNSTGFISPGVYKIEKGEAADG